jgi:putative restriction endonuclease
MLEGQRQLHGDTLPRALLLEGFTFEDTRVPLLAPQGIFTRQSSTCH